MKIHHSIKVHLLVIHEFYELGSLLFYGTGLLSLFFSVCNAYL